MMHHIVIVDNPVPAAAFALLLGQLTGWQASALAPKAAHEAPPGALVLIEERLPNQSGLRLVRQLVRARPDLVPILWTRQSTPLMLWAATEWKLPGVLDKATPLDELLRQLDQARRSRAAWGGDLLEQARAWNNAVAVHLKDLTGGHWMLWRDIVRGAGCTHIATAHGWSLRTAERRQTELYLALGLENRAEAVSRAWVWGLVDDQPDGLEWNALVEELLIDQIAAEAVNN